MSAREEFPARHHYTDGHQSLYEAMAPLAALVALWEAVHRYEDDQIPATADAYRAHLRAVKP